LNYYYVDGNFVSSEQAVIPVNDLALLRGLGVFDLLRTYGGKPLFLHEHVDRLENSAKEVGLIVNWTHDEIVDIVMKTLEKNDLDEANIRMIITGGSSSDFITPDGGPRLLVLISPTPTLPLEWYEQGVKVISCYSERSVPGAKSIDYIPATIALKKAKKLGAVEVIYIDHKNRVLEGTTSNIFVLKGNKLITPGKDILSGVTRKVILKMAKTLFDIEIRDLNKKELLNADEVFITGTNKGLIPVVQVDETTIGSGKPGANTQNLIYILKKNMAQFTA